MVRPEATEDGELTCPAAARRGTGPQGAEQQEGHGRSRRRLHDAAVSPPRWRRSAPHARAAGPGPSPRVPRLAWAAPSQPRPMLRRPWRCSLHRGAASVLHCAPRALLLAGGASECCIGRLAVAKWLLAPPTSSPGEGSGRQGALRRERAPGALAPRAPTGARAQESAGKCSSLARTARLHHPAGCCDLVTAKVLYSLKTGGGEKREKKRGHRWQAFWHRGYPTVPLWEPVFISTSSTKNCHNVSHK